MPAAFSEARDCYHPSDKHANTRLDRHNCVVDRIKMFTQTLADLKASRSDRIEALKFLVHFVGDIHQPLHAIGEARGGNDIHVIEFGSAQCGSRPCNLHFVWDLGLIEHSARHEFDYVQFLEKLIARDRLSGRTDGGPEAWANESFHLAKKVWVSNGGVVDETYYRKSIPIVDKQLELAGVRLAKILNEALGRNQD
jgi:S1/P1 Nuclease